MKLVVIVKLIPSPEQRAALLETMERFNTACSAITEVAFKQCTASKYKLQKLVYRDVRERFGLSAQMTVRAIAKVCEVYKRDKKIKPEFRDHGAIVYDERILSWRGAECVSILTLRGRQLIPLALGEHQRKRLGGLKGQADLVLRDSGFYLYATCDVAEAKPHNVDGFLGIDLGIKNIAADNDGTTYSGAQLNSLRKRNVRLRSKLQGKGTKSAKRLLRKRRRKERRFGRDVNHCISKTVVRKAIDTNRGIAVEELKGIRGRITVRKSQRRTHASWAFRQLRSFLEYKAALAGLPLVAVDPRHTSTTCPECGHVNKRNRPTRDRFCCKRCGHAAPADETAARVIASRAAISQPNAGECGASRHAPPASPVVLERDS